MNIVVLTQQCRGEIVELFVCDASTCTLCAILLHVRSRYDLATTSLRSTRFRGDCATFVYLGASATLPLRSWRSCQLQAWFKCSPEVGVTLLDSRTNSVEDLVKSLMQMKNKHLYFILSSQISWS